MTEYKRLLGDWSKVNHDDYDTTWSIANRAVAIADYFNDKLAGFEQILGEAKVEAEHKQEVVSIDKDSGSVANGKRQAIADESVKAMKLQIVEAEYFVSRLTSILRTLDNIRYQAVVAYDKGNQKYRRKDV